MSSSVLQVEGSSQTEQSTSLSYPHTGIICKRLFFSGILSSPSFCTAVVPCLSRTRFDYRHSFTSLSFRCRGAFLRLFITSKYGFSSLIFRWTIYISLLVCGSLVSMSCFLFLLLQLYWLMYSSTLLTVPLLWYGNFTAERCWPRTSRYWYPGVCWA